MLLIHLKVISYSINIGLSSVSPGLPGWLRGLKRLSTMRETWVRSLGREDPLEKEMATHSSVLA